MDIVNVVNIMKREGKPSLIILDKDFEKAARMLTEKDLSRQIINAHNLLLRVYFKRYGLCNANIWKNVLDTNNDILYKAFPNWPVKFYPVKPPKSRVQEFKFVKLCLNNFKYVLDYAFALCDEYEYRFKKPHTKIKIFDWIQNNLLEMPYAENYSISYPILTIPIRFRKTNYFISAQNLYKSIVENPLDEYNKVDVPDFFNLKDISQ